MVVKIKSELLDQKSLTSPNCYNFEIFDHDPNLTSNFETHKNVGDNFYFAYKYLYTLIVQIIVTLNNRDGFIVFVFLVGGG